MDMEITMELLVQVITQLLMICGGLVLVVNVIVQVVKNIGPLEGIPTNIVVLALSQVFSFIAYPLFFDLKGFGMMWYMWVATAVLGFMVAFVAMYGWDKFNELLNRSKYSGKDGNTGE